MRTLDLSNTETLDESVSNAIGRTGAISFTPQLNIGVSAGEGKGDNTNVSAGQGKGDSPRTGATSFTPAINTNVSAGQGKGDTTPKFDVGTPNVNYGANTGIGNLGFGVGNNGIPIKFTPLPSPPRGGNPKPDEKGNESKPNADNAKKGDDSEEESFFSKNKTLIIGGSIGLVVLVVGGIIVYKKFIKK